ncbi:hypothetical protein IFM89_023789 [Coptis chinensis]|uniref:PPPDE domain-containing protein n=1 Tax=Coptis chinensis TaxID=261450 RepID=A0A835LNT7_9MAGN|nr:hypothetical protein IFM89_023789 [Coptis chinensis]
MILDLHISLNWEISLFFNLTYLIFIFYDYRNRHTGVVVYGNEYYFGGGIQHAPVGTTPYGNPIRVVDLGFTHVPKELFEEYLQEISPRYPAETYSSLEHNCNNFSNEVTQFLVGTDIPDYILQLPNEVLNSPMGALICDVPQAPQFRPMPLTQPRPFMSTTVNSNADKTTTTTSTTITESRETKSGSVAEVLVKSVGDSAEVSEKLSTSNDTKTITKKSTVGAPKKKVDGVAGDPLRNVRSKIQEEIGREFAAIMARGTLRASE